nr:integrase, catalytic region, zinc finger, CCHC-type, peptidase aspartic, catalytic [Tanacetum cinerariifolium]
MLTQQDIYAAGSENCPPMLNKENYVPWSSHLLRYAKSRPNGKLIHNSIINGPYVRRMIPEPGDSNREVSVNETFHVQTDDELTEKEPKQIEADDQAIQTILLSLPEDIYAVVDSCETAQEIWFTSNDGESIESYYHRFLKLMNDLKQNKHFPKKIVSNLKFLNNLQPEWSRHVTIVHQTKDLHTADYTQLYDFLKYNQKENYMQQPMPNLEDITDPTTAMNMALALMAKAFKLNYPTPTNNNQRISLNPRNRQIAQPSMNMGQDRQMQMVGRNGRNQLRQYAWQNVGNLNGYNDVQNVGNQNPNGNARAEGNAPGHNGNQIRCYNCRGVGHFARNCTVRPRTRDAAYLQTQLLIAQKEEAGIQLQDEEFDLMAVASDLDEIKEVNANYILIENLQQASTSDTQTDKAPVYDSDGSAKVHNYEDCFDNKIFIMFTQEEQYTELLEPILEPHQVPHNDNNVISEVSCVEQSGGTVEQHPTNVEETRALYDSLYNNLVIEVEKINTVNHKLSETNAELTTELARYKNQERVQNFEIQFLKEAAKFVGDFKSLAKEADESLVQHQALKLEIERLLRAVVSQDIMFVVQNNSVVDTTNLQSELERTKKRFENCIIKKENEYAKLWNDWFKKCEECKFDKISYDKAHNDMQQKIKRLQAQLGDLQENAHLKTTYKNLFDSISVTRTQTKTIIDSLQHKLHDTIYENAKLRAQLFDNVSDQKTACGKSVNTKFSKQSILGKPPKVDETHALSKPVTSNSIPTLQGSQVVKNDKVIALGMFRINPFKPSREEKHVPNKVRASIRTKPITISQPPVITKKVVNSDSNGLSSTGVDNTKTRRPQPRSNTKNDRVVEARIKKLNMSSRGKTQTENVSINENQKKQKPKVKKTKKVGPIERLASPKPSKPRSFLRWSPIGRLFDLKGKVIASSESESQSDCSNGFGDLQWGNILITRVYFVEGLGHNLFSVGQFCDSDLEVAFRRNACFIRNIEGVDLLKGNRSTNLYTINLYEMASASPICLMAHASSTKSWLWHQRSTTLEKDKESLYMMLQLQLFLKYRARHGALVKDKQEKDKIGSKPNKNGKRGEAEKRQKQFQSIKKEKLKKMQKERPKVQSPTSYIKERRKKGLNLQLLQSNKRRAISAIVGKLYWTRTGCAIYHARLRISDLGFDQTQPPQSPVIHQPPQELSIQEMEDLKQHYLDELKRLSNLEYRDEIKIAELTENFNDEAIKSSVEDLVPIPSESEGIPGTMCDVHLVNNPTPLEANDHFEIALNSNDDISSSDDDSLYKENIDLEVAEIVIPEDEEIEDDNLREKLLNVRLLIANIEALKDNPTPSSEFLTKSSSTSPKSFLEETYTFHNSLPELENFCFDLEEISSGSTTTHSDMSLPDYEVFYFDDDHIKEISSGSTTTHFDISLSEYESFVFDPSNDQFPPSDRSDFTDEEFTDELTHIISPPEYDCFCFRNLPDPGELMSILNSRIRENLSTTCVYLQIEDNHSPLLAYVVWIFLAYITYPVIPPYLHSFGNEDTIFDPGIIINRVYSFKHGLSHWCGAFKKFNTHRSHLNKWSMIINGKNTPILDVLLFHFYPPLIKSGQAFADLKNSRRMKNDSVTNELDAKQGLF